MPVGGVQNAVFAYQHQLARVERGDENLRSSEGDDAKQAIQRELDSLLEETEAPVQRRPQRVNATGEAQAEEKRITLELKENSVERTLDGQERPEKPGYHGVSGSEADQNPRDEPRTYPDDPTGNPHQQAVGKTLNVLL
jgi:hypothetical protein